MPSPIASPLVELTGAHVALGGEIVLRDITWALRPGEHWLVSGSNGAGKTTLLRVVRGELPIVHGAGTRTYNLAGDGDTLATAKARIGYLSPELHERLLRMELPLTVRELITGGIAGALYLAQRPTFEQRRAVEQQAESVGLSALLEEPMLELSFGQLRRALLARALASKPRLLVLDEFAHGLDRKSRDLIFDTLARISNETSLVVATHRREELPHDITHELRLAGGRVERQGEFVATAPATRAGTALDGAPPRTSSEPPVVKLQNVDVYVERRRVLRDLSWEIRAGERWLVSGENGSGKTTLAKLLYGRLRAAHGGVVERYGDAGSVSVAELRRTVALISDDEQLRYDWNDSIETVVASGYFASVGLMQKPTPEQIEGARRLIADFGLEDLRERRFLQLSFGQRRLVLVARALVRTPRLLILDEALNGFDADARRRILGRVEELANSGTAIVMIAHHESDVPDWVDKELQLSASHP